MLERDYLETNGPARSFGSIFNVIGEGRKAEPDVRMLIAQATKNDPAFARDLALGGIIGEMMTTHIAKLEDLISAHSTLLDDQATLIETCRDSTRKALDLHLIAVRKEAAIVHHAIDGFRKEWAGLAVEMHAMRRNLDTENRWIKFLAGAFGILAVIVIGAMLLYIMNHRGA